MKIQELVKDLNCETVNVDIGKDVETLCINDGECKPNSLFFCIKGNTTDGHKFAEKAISAGAHAVVCDKELRVEVPQIRVKNVRKALTHMCKRLYDEPYKKIRTIGVVGTNGKTTVCETICEILSGAGIKCGTIGTNGIFDGKKRIKSGFTTPDSPTIYSALREMIANKIDVVCMELSAHAIFYGKCDFKFDIVVFTNCTPEHLDFFKSFRQYANVKAKAFSNRNCKLAVVNSDDPVGLYISAMRKNGVITYGIQNPSDVFAVDVEETTYGSSFIMNLFDVLYDISANRFGRFNVYNLLAVATVCALCGVKTDYIAEKMQNLSIVKGRMQLVASKINVFIDYAHTPDGLENALKTLTNVKGNNKLICVFGCGGNRDKSKRSVMGEISGKYADFTVITSDNPRFEEAGEIIKEIECGIRRVTYDYITISDRARAIEYAVNRACLGDYVLIAGKGAEEYQECMGISRYFSDAETACYYVLRKYDEL